MNRSYAVAALLATSVALTGCTSDPATRGKVTGKREKFNPATKVQDHFLTVDGKEYKVTYPTWSSCKTGSSYPDCKEG